MISYKYHPIYEKLSGDQTEISKFKEKMFCYGLCANIIYNLHHFPGRFQSTQTQNKNERGTLASARRVYTIKQVKAVHNS